MSVQWPIEVSVASLRKTARRVSGDVNGWQQSNLSDRMGVESVHHISIDLEMRAWRKTGAALRGTASALVTRRCSVSLDPYQETVRAVVDRTFLPNDEIETDAPIREIEIDPDAPDPPDPFDGHVIEIGEIIVEELVLVLPLHPRKPGLEFDPAYEDLNTSADSPDSREGNRPFSDLARLLDTGSEE